MAKAQSASASATRRDEAADARGVAGRQGEQSQQPLAEPQRRDIENEAADVGHAAREDGDSGRKGGEGGGGGEGQDRNRRRVARQAGAAGEVARQRGERDERRRAVEDDERRFIGEARQRRGRRHDEAGGERRRPGIIVLDRGEEGGDQLRPAAGLRQ